MASKYESPGDIQIQDGAIVGLEYRSDAGPARFGSGCVVRAGAIIYGDVTTGDRFQCGHHAVVREKTRIGLDVIVGTQTVIDGQVNIGDYVKIESNCYIPTHVTIGGRVFIGPGVTMMNDRYPLKMRDDYRPEGPVIEDDVTIGGGVSILPGVTIGRGSFIAAASVVTKDVPPMSFVVGLPGRVSPLPEKLRERNMALSWRRHLVG